LRLFVLRAPTHLKNHGAFLPHRVFAQPEPIPDEVARPFRAGPLKDRVVDALVLDSAHQAANALLGG
jgi:hypothetical protein